jgi:hypothetical protein
MLLARAAGGSAEEKAALRFMCRAAASNKVEAGGWGVRGGTPLPFFIFL